MNTTENTTPAAVPTALESRVADIGDARDATALELAVDALIRHRESSAVLNTAAADGAYCQLATTASARALRATVVRCSRNIRADDARPGDVLRFGGGLYNPGTVYTVREVTPSGLTGNRGTATVWHTPATEDTAAYLRDAAAPVELLNRPTAEEWAVITAALANAWRARLAEIHAATGDHTDARRHALDAAAATAAAGEVLTVGAGVSPVASSPELLTDAATDMAVAAYRAAAAGAAVAFSAYATALEHPRRPIPAREWATAHQAASMARDAWRFEATHHRDN